jgi:sugar lactone lactonase YvrE
MALTGELRTLAEGLDHPEGVCWSPKSGSIYAGGEAGQIYRVQFEGGFEQVADVPGGFILGLAVDADDVIYACDGNGKHVMRIDLRDGGAPRPYGDSMVYPNYPAFDSDGNLWVSDSGDWGAANGALCRISPGGKLTERVVEGLDFANGLAIDDTHVYVIESKRPGVVRVPLGGGPTNRVVELPQTVPDGLAFDSEGGLWISLYEPHSVLRMGHDGTVGTMLADWTGLHVTSPTNIAFAGDDLAVLVLASLSGWAVKAIDPGVQGRRLHYPAVTGP